MDISPNSALECDGDMEIDFSEENNETERMSSANAQNEEQSEETAVSGEVIEFDGTTVLCRVCGDKASGFHYGVHSCEGCKGFFRRSIQQKIQYRPCTKNQQCSILRINRNRCQYCRLKKCIAVGMSRDAVRFGRVPKREKAKILAAMQSVNARSAERALSVELEDESRLIATVVRAHIDTCDYTRDKIGPLLQRAREQPVYTQCPPQLACPLNPNPHVLQNGNQRLLEDFSERFSPAIRGVVEFAKKTPGFALLSQDDQVTLLKAGVFEVLLVRLACMFDSATNTMMCLNGQVLKREALHNSSNARFLMDSMFDFADRLNSLRLHDAEVALFCAVVVIADDRPGLRNVDLVKKMQLRMLQALQTTILQYHPESPLLFQELIKKIPDLRTLNTLHSEKLLAFKMEPKTHIEQQDPQPIRYQQPEILVPKMTSDWSAPHRHITAQHRSPITGDTVKWDEHDMVSASQRSSDSGWAGSTPGSHDHDWNNSSPRSIRSDEGSVKSPMGSVKSGDGSEGSDLNHHLSDLSVNGKRQRDNSQSEAGFSDEGQSGTAEQPKCPYKHRKLDSPSDSGIESSKEQGSSGSSNTSVCSSPRSAIDDKVKDVSDSEDKGDSIEDMPVLKRALQAPPLINTNLLMDETYKRHKKFRALRKEGEQPDTATPSPNPSPSLPLASPSGSNLSLASSHSTLVQTLQQGPKLSEQQLKRSDMLHNIIMRSDNQQPPNGGVMYGGVNPSAAFVTRAPNGKNLVVCAGPNGYYIPSQQMPTMNSFPSAQWPFGSSSSSTARQSPITVQPRPSSGGVTLQIPINHHHQRVGGSAPTTPQPQHSPCLPRMYYDPRTPPQHTPPSTTPPHPVPSFSPHHSKNVNVIPAKSPVSRVVHSPVDEQGCSPPVTTGEGQPLNLSKKPVSPSPPPASMMSATPILCAALDPNNHFNPHLGILQKIKLEV